MMPSSMIRSARRAGSTMLGFTLAMALAGCDTMASNRLLDSVHQPVVEHSQYDLDLTSGPRGLDSHEQGRLEGWFAALNLRYGDRIAIDDPLASPVTRSAVKSAAAHYGLLISPETPVTQGYVNAGTVRVIVTRSTASVPHCPDLSTKSETNFANATSANYGCAVNSNIAAMVANPDDLLNGAHGSGLTTIDTADKAIWAHQDVKPQGTGVRQNGTK
jgi:pilus assembly protein CpaD